MVGCKSGLVGRLRTKLAALGITNQFAAVHCILRQEALCSKSLQMKGVMDIVFSAVNFIRSKALSHRQFVSLLEAISSEYGEILYHTEVRWLSRGRVLKRLFDLREEIDTFMKSKNRAITELSDERWLHSLAVLTDITDHLNCLNLQMQLLELKANTKLKQKFQDVGVPDFHEFLDDAFFPALCRKAARIIAMFGSTYLCEHLFSLLKVNKSALRSRM
ncbi:unnamed protein product, partial [Ixodes hexagonus]